MSTAPAVKKRVPKTPIANPAMASLTAGDQNYLLKAYEALEEIKIDYHKLAELMSLTNDRSAMNGFNMALKKLTGKTAAGFNASAKKEVEGSAAEAPKKRARKFAHVEATEDQKPTPAPKRAKKSGHQSTESVASGLRHVDFGILPAVDHEGTLKWEPSPKADVKAEAAEGVDLHESARTHREAFTLAEATETAGEVEEDRAEQDLD
ncbi:hypothetical protein MMC30_002428 [Trapelia coarctata]|nr:hypothetical protein [Trapelia coarctata]